MAVFAGFRRDVKKRARILTKSEFKHALDIASLTRDPERNQLIVCLTHALGLRVSECAQITVRDMLYPSGRIRDEITCRAEITKFNRTRTVPVSSRRLRDALDTYLDFRVREDIGLVPAGTDEFRGLSPDLPLVFSSRDSGFALVRKRRVLESGEVEDYMACDGLEGCFRRLYKQAGLAGASSHSLSQCGPWCAYIGGRMGNGAGMCAALRDVAHRGGTRTKSGPCEARGVARECCLVVASLEILHLRSLSGYTQAHQAYWGFKVPKTC